MGNHREANGINVIQLLDNWHAWLCPILATTAGGIYALGYLWRRYKHRFCFARSTLAFKIFVSLSAFSGLFSYLLVSEHWLPNEPSASLDNKDKNLKDESVAPDNSYVMSNYLLALGCGASLMLGAVVGIRRPSSQSQFVDLLKPLIEPIEEQMDAAVDEKVVQLIKDCPQLSQTPINTLAIAIELVVEGRMKRKDPKFIQTALEIEEVRANGNRFGLVKLLLNFYTPKSVNGTFTSYFLREAETMSDPTPHGDIENSD